MNMKVSKIFPAPLSIMLCLLFFSAHSFAAGQDAEDKKINWLSFEDAIRLNKRNPKKIFVDVYTEWCLWCKVMEKKTFVDPLIVDYMNKNYYAVKFNGESRDPIQFRGRTYRFGETGRYHELAAHLLCGEMVYPTYVILDERFDILRPIRGFRGPQELDMILKYFGDNHHKNTDYESFCRTYESPYSGYSMPSYRTPSSRLVGH
jgi:thioredoxin-related protein